MIPAAARIAMEGVVPSVISTVNKEGVPNISYVSQVWYVDASHVAVSHQYFNKTMRNLREVPHAVVQAFDPRTLNLWEMRLKYEGSYTSGAVFEQMEMHLEALGSMTGTQGLWHLKAAEVFAVESIRQVLMRRPD